MAGDTENVFKILVATDNHVGYMEKDQVRGTDSLEAFEEVLMIAQDQQVDFILLGGDLFHDNKPSRQVLTRTMELLRHYCMGERPCPIEFRSDQAVNFHHSKFPVVNYEDPNYNVSIPIFSIHGNHDDPAGVGNLSAMDVLSVANLVNYFGKTPNVEAIEVSPLLLQKGTSRLALYGLGSCRDERLHRMMRRKRVTFLRPDEREEEGGGEAADDSWFSLLVLHQNRAKHGQTNHIPENFLPGFLDLVIWGHEHECRIDAEYSVVGTDVDGEEQGIYISQPGSSIATSLSEGETKKKHVGILYIKGTSFKIEPIPLKCVRPFVMDSVVLSQTGIHYREEGQISAYLSEKVRMLIEQVNSDNPQDKLPLVRLKVEYSGDYETFSMARFGQKFVTQVANPRSILHWYRQKKKTQKKDDSPEPAYLLGGGEGGEGESLSMHVLVEEQLQNHKLNLLSEKNLTEALTQFVEKEETDAIANFVRHSLKQAQNYLKERPGINETDIDTQIARQREELVRRQEEGASIAHMEMSQARSESSNRTDEDRRNEEGEGEVDGQETGTTTSSRGRKGSTSETRGRGRGRGRGGRGRAKGATGAKGKSSTASKGSAAATPAALEFSSVGSKTTRSTKPARNNKRIVYEESDDSPEEEVSFIPPSKRKKNKEESAIDLTQFSGDSDGDDGDGGNVSMYSAPLSAVRRKR